MFIAGVTSDLTQCCLSFVANADCHLVWSTYSAYCLLPVTQCLTLTC